MFGGVGVGQGSGRLEESGGRREEGGRRKEERWEEGGGRRKEGGGRNETNRRVLWKTRRWLARAGLAPGTSRRGGSRGTMAQCDPPALSRWE